MQEFYIYILSIICHNMLNLNKKNELMKMKNKI